MGIGIGVCGAVETQELATERTITPIQKIFLDSRSHFGNHGPVITLRTTVSTTVPESRAFAAGQLKLPYGNQAENPRRTVVVSRF